MSQSQKRPGKIALSLNLSKRPAKRPKLAAGAAVEGGAEAAAVDYVKEVDGGAIGSVAPVAAKQAKVIPLTVNPWVKDKAKAKGAEANGDGAAAVAAPPKSLDDLAAEALVKGTHSAAASPTTLAATPITPAAAALPELSGADADADPNKPAQTIALITKESAGGPILQANAMPGINEIENEGEKFAYDVSMRADDVTAKSECYSSMPIADYGEALLRGMGWTGHDDSNKAAKAAEPRGHRLGLGATPRPPSPLGDGRKRAKKPGEKARRGEAEAKAWAKEAEKKLKSQKLAVGDRVWLRDPKYAAKEGTLTKTTGVPGLNRVEVKLDSGEVVTVVRKDAVLIDGGGEGGGAQPRAREDAPSAPSRSGASAEPVSSSHSSSRKTWVIPGIRVRIVKSGDHYRQKGRVHEYSNSRDEATVRLDDGGKKVRDLRGKDLETVVPSIGGTVLVVRGKYRKCKATLLDKDRDREEARVEIRDEKKEATVSLDDIAEF